jgi:hypothetical protein
LLDSECSNHLTREKDLFTSLKFHDIPKEIIIFGDNSKGDMIGLGKVAHSNDNSISNVYFVETLGYNLLSVSQFCEKGYNYFFTNEGVTISRRKDSSIAFAGCLKGKIYLVDFSKEKVEPETCLVAKSDLASPTSPC